jgi:hypothetical protein
MQKLIHISALKAFSVFNFRWANNVVSSLLMQFDLRYGKAVRDYYFINSNDEKGLLNKAYQPLPVTVFDLCGKEVAQNKTSLLY